MPGPCSAGGAGKPVIPPGPTVAAPDVATGSSWSNTQARSRQSIHWRTPGTSRVELQEGRWTSELVKESRTGLVDTRAQAREAKASADSLVNNFLLVKHSPELPIST